MAVTWLLQPVVNNVKSRTLLYLLKTVSVGLTVGIQHHRNIFAEQRDHSRREH